MFDLLRHNIILMVFHMQKQLFVEISYFATTISKQIF